MRSMAIFLFEQQRGRRGAKESLPDWQLSNVRQPHWLIQTLVAEAA